MAFVERQRGGRHLVTADKGTEECSGWVAVCALDDIVPGRGVQVMLKGSEVAVMRDGDAVHALGGTCPHRGGQIGDGTVVDGKAVCPLHLWDFDLRTGISPFNPRDTVPTYGARVTDGTVEVDADSVPRGRGGRTCTSGGGPAGAPPTAACTWCTT